MKYRILSVGKIREPFYRQGIEEYLKRLSAFGRFELVEGLEEKLKPPLSERAVAKALEKEGEKILHLITADEWVVILDQEGQKPDSISLAEELQKWHEGGSGRVTFVIGASHGLAPAVKKRADYRLSISALTFPHQMAVLILTEQIYRSFRIMRGEPYHK
ncbi:MAG TPA: 23S rRNA (pseudouridine(1915)-N(3))-methyltransferase RlmH [Syntrophomonadaceae bacterium]|jgi:23S rRNA (pseudouridine1915-N3)-methyltransferase|nr:23S rRNA (pseudouridine(1915)-N(3))-methyltransferase RlmH [Syntrophomonadaceae bacterium]